MGISTNVYTIYGVKIEWNDDFSDSYEEVYNDQDVPFVLMDGMSGEYMIFGLVLFDSGDFRWGDLNGEKETKLLDLAKLEEEYKLKFKNKFPDYYDLINKEWNFIGIVHYS